MKDARRYADLGGASELERSASVSQGVVRVDGAGIVTYVDAYTAQIMGYAAEEMQGRYFADFSVKEEQAKATANFERRRLGIGGVTEYRMRRKNGTVRWLALATVPTFDADNTFLGVTCFITDIDERKRQQEMSVHEHRLLRQIAGNYPLASVLEDLCVTLEAFSRRQLLAAVMLVERNTLRCIAAPSLPARFREERAAVCLDDDVSPCAQAVRSGSDVIVGDTAPDETATARAHGFGAVWSYPIVQDEETLGTLSLFLLAPGEPDADDARAIAFALQVARLALAHERKTLEVLESERRFRDFAELSADWFWEQDADLRFTRITSGVRDDRRSVVRTVDIVGKTRWELPVESADASAMAAHRALLGRREAFADFEYALRGADGSLRWVSVTGKPVFAGDGEFLGYRGTSRDITHARRAHDALLESGQRFRDFVELSADWVWEQDADFRFTSMSGDVFNKGGFRIADALGKTRWELPIEGIDEAQWAEHRAQLDRHESLKDFSYAIRVADGTRRCYSVSGRPVFAADGKFLGYRGTSRDITAQVSAREALEKSRRWLEQAIQAGGIGLWECDIDAGTVSFTKNWKALFGFADDEIVSTTTDFYHLVHPDDLEPIRAAGRNHLLTPHGDHETRFRVRHEDGSWRTVLSRGNDLTESVTGRRIWMGALIDITGQMRQAEALRISEQRFRDYAELSADWFWELDAELRFTAMSFGGSHELGATRFVPSETIGRHPWELPHHEGHDDSRDAHRRALDAHQAVKDLHVKERYPDGTTRHAIANSKPIFDAAGTFTGYRGVGRDVTAQVNARESLEKTLLWLKQAVSTASIGLWECDIDASTVRFAESWNELFGYAEGEVDPDVANFYCLIHPDDLALLRDFGRDYLTNPVSETERRFRIRHKDGTWRWVLVRGSVMTDTVTGRRTWMGCHIDITRQVEAEQKISDLAAMLEVRVNARTAELEEANRELDAFNYSVTHDLRTPLRAIEGFSKALLEDCGEQIDQAGQEYLQRICRSTARMGELIDALYELSRMSRSPLRLGTVDLSAIALEIAAELRAHDAGRAVDFEIAGTPLVEGDAPLLRIVLANLLGNAWKFTGHTTPARIVFDAQRDDSGRVVYSVRDNGAGFDMRFADKLFRIFHRLHRDEEFPGQGVGLTTVQRIVARHGGRIWGESAGRGKGATLHFTLWNDPALLIEARGQ